MKIDNIQAKRLYDSIFDIEGEEKANQIMEGLPLSETPADNERYEWACNMCDSLNKNFDKNTVTQIRKGCKCGPMPSAVEFMKSLWDDSSDVSDFARRTRENPKAHPIELDGDELIMTYPHCYCEFINHTGSPVPAQWCDCTLGYAEEMFSKVTGKDTRAELLESVITGGKQCRIKIYL